MPPKKKIFTTYKCDICNKGFESNSYLQRHKEIHTDELKFACPQCDFRCKRSQYLTRHIRAIHQDCRQCECDICGKRFLFPSKLAAHKLVHTGEKPYECNQCGKSFNSTYSLKTHMLIHTGEKPFKCSYCAYACRDCSTLRKHEERHQDTVRLYRCLTCHRKMRSKWQLKNHIAEKHLNLDLRKYFCDVCHKGFKAKNILTRHVKNVHLKMKMAACAVCGITISNYSNMSAHMLTHVEHRPYSCSFQDCSHKFKTKSDLKKHEIIHKPEQHVKCEICERSFARLSRLERHLLQHARPPKEKTIQCLQCDERFINPFHLKKHRRIAHPGVRFMRRQKYECDLCGFITYLRSCIIMHLKYGHAGDRYLKHCNECKQKFRKEFSYIIHMATEHGTVIKEAAVGTAKISKTDKRAIADIVIKEEIEEESEDSVSADPVDLFEVEKEEVLEDHLPKEIQATILSAMQSEIADRDEDYDSDDNKTLSELHTISIQNDDNVLQENSSDDKENLRKIDVIQNSKDTDSIQKVKDANLSIAISIQCGECPIKYIKDDENSVGENIDNKSNCMEVDSIQHSTKYDQDNYDIIAEEKDNLQNSIHNGEYGNEECSIQKDGLQDDNNSNTTQNEQGHTDTIQNDFHTVGVTENSQCNEDIHIDKNNYVDVIKQLIIENRNELQKISDEVFDEFFIDRVEGRIKKKVKKPMPPYLNKELQEKMKKDIKEKVVEARRQQLAGALERTRRLYNNRLNRAMGIVNPKEKVQVKYFNKNQVQLVELTPPEENDAEKEDCDLNNTDHNNTRNKTNDKRIYSKRVGAKTDEINNLKISFNNKNQTAKANNSTTSVPVNTENQSSLWSTNDICDNHEKDTTDLNRSDMNLSLYESSDRNKTNDNNDSNDRELEISRGTEETLSENNNKSQTVDKTQENTNETSQNTDKSSPDTAESHINNEEISNIDGVATLLEERPQNDEDSSVVERSNYNSKCKLKLNTHQCYVCFKLYKTKEELLEHCKDHFDVITSTSLKKCPICAIVTELSLGKHIRKAHGLKIKVPYGTIHDQNTDQRISKYYYKMDDSEGTEFRKIEVIPSVKCLNNIASRKIEKLSRDIKDKTISKTKLVKKGKEWIVENERIEFDKSFLLPKFDIKDIEINAKKIKVNGKYNIVFNYLENLKRLYKIAKKKGQKMLFPCKDCDKVCLNMSALKLHVRKHDPNKKPFKKKVWKHKLKDNFVKDKDRKKRSNKENTKKGRGVKRKIKKDSIDDLYKMSLKERIRRNKRLKPTAAKNVFEMSIKDRINMNKRRINNRTDHNILKNGDTVADRSSTEVSKYVSSENHRHPRDIENRERRPRPVKNKHKCDPQLIEFYNQNVKGGDIEFWQFLKIFNRMSKDNVNEFEDLKERTDFGLHFDDKNGDEVCTDDIPENSNEETDNAVNNNVQTNTSSESVGKNYNVSNKTTDGDDNDSNNDLEAITEMTKNSNTVEETPNITNKTPETYRQRYAAENSGTDHVQYKPKTVKNMVAINRPTDKGFRKGSLVAKKRGSHLSRNEIAKREAHRRLLRENLLKLRD